MLQQQFNRTSHYLKKRSDLKQITLQIADGMAYLETTNCIHTDLRAAKILVGNHNEVKVASFGMAQLTEGGVYVVDGSKCLLDVSVH
jgi:serine/threonine protein kinase